MIQCCINNDDDDDDDDMMMMMMGMIRLCRGSMYAINMQLGGVQASTDQPRATLAIVFNTPPPGLRTSDFSLATSQGGQGSNVTAVAPYLSNSIYIMQVVF